MSPPAHPELLLTLDIRNHSWNNNQRQRSVAARATTATRTTAPAAKDCQGSEPRATLVLDPSLDATEASHPAVGVPTGTSPVSTVA